MLTLFRDSEMRGESLMTIERAVNRSTGEFAAWFRLLIGQICIGRQVGLVIVYFNGSKTNPERDSPLGHARLWILKEIGSTRS